MNLLNQRGSTLITVIIASSTALIIMLGVMRLVELSNREQAGLFSNMGFQQLQGTMNMMLSHAPLCDENFINKKIYTPNFFNLSVSYDWSQHNGVPEFTRITFDGDVVVPDQHSSELLNVLLKVQKVERGADFGTSGTQRIYTAEVLLKADRVDQAVGSKTQSASFPIKFIVEEKDMHVPTQPPIILSCHIEL